MGGGVNNALSNLREVEDDLDDDDRFDHNQRGMINELN